ncbi:MAG: 2-amino-4-oxopentanoate thiolase subunit OrtA [Acholeplasmataceae bacterium]|jgi:hypothetical protein
MIPKGTYVEIEKVVLFPDERASHIPLDTKKLPLVMRIKGFLSEDSLEGQEVNILTVTKRLEKGKLVAVKPFYSHTFGHFVDEVMEVRLHILKEMEDYHE